MKRFAAVWGATILLSLGLLGCSEQELQRWDGYVADACDVGQTIGALPDSPAGPLIPAEVRLIMEILGLGTAAAYGIWQKIRKDGVLAEKQSLTLTAKAIVNAIEKLPAEPQELVKSNVGAEMARMRIRDAGSAEVEKLKTG